MFIVTLLHTTGVWGRSEIQVNANLRRPKHFHASWCTFIFVSFQLDVNNASPEEAEAYRKKLMNDANRMDMAISALFGK